MTSKAITRTQEVGSVERFPDFPPRDDMQNWLFLYDSAILTALTIHFADLPNTTTTTPCLRSSVAPDHHFAATPCHPTALPPASDLK